MAKAYVRLDKIQRFAHVESVVSEKELQAGHFVHLGEVINTPEGEEVHVVEDGVKTPFKALVAPVFVVDETVSYDVTEAVVKPGKPARAYIIQPGDVVSFLESQVDAEDGYVKIAADNFGMEAASSEDEADGMIIANDYLDGVGNLTVVRFF